MSSTQLKAAQWGWRAYTNEISEALENSPLVAQTQMMPIWLSVSLAFGVVVASAFCLKLLYTATTATFSETATFYQLVGIVA